MSASLGVGHQCKSASLGVGHQYNQKPLHYFSQKQSL